MKGIMFNLLEEVVADAHGPFVWDELLDALALEGVYTAVDTYDDGEFLALVRALPPPPSDPDAAATGPGIAGSGGTATAVVQAALPTVAERTRWYGRRALPQLSQRYPTFFEPYDDARDFLASVESVIHTEVRKVLPTAALPRFGVHQDVAPDGTRRLTLTYVSDRGLCHLAEGFVLGAGDHYGQALHVHQAACMHTGDPSCRLVVGGP